MTKAFSEYDFQSYLLQKSAIIFYQSVLISIEFRQILGRRHDIYSNIGNTISLHFTNGFIKSFHFQFKAFIILDFNKGQSSNEIML